MYESKDFTKGRDGLTKNGNDAQADTYFWKIIDDNIYEKLERSTEILP